MRVENRVACWCGSNDSKAFSQEYRECNTCGTLISQAALSAAELLVKDDEQDFYGKHYWLEHQKCELGLPDIHTRARRDLTERNLHWLRALLKYRLPPSNILELGCAHGSFVALLRQSGFEASGVEMSPWVVSFARETFDIPVQVGPIEALDLPLGSLDVIVLMDVLEHLPNPQGTMARCLELLKPEGLLLIQTPEFKVGTSYAGLSEIPHPFLEMLQADEHIYLFSRPSVTEMFRRLGVEYLSFESAIFAHYDMFFFASRTPLVANNPDSIEAALQESPGGRLALALLDLRERELSMASDFQIADADRAARSQQVESLTGLLRESEIDRAARGQQVESLTGLLRESEIDRTARGQQVESLTCLLQESENDRVALKALVQECASARESQDQDLRALFRRPQFKILYRAFGWPELTRLRMRLDNFVMQTKDRALRTIVVDLTPVLPGGENGGAKIFILELLRRLAVDQPQTRFVLLTLAASHQELATLDGPNMTRHLVGGPEPQTTPITAPAHPPLVRRIAARLMARLPEGARGALRRWRRRLLPSSMAGSSGVLHELGADLLFCPFGAPSFHEAGIPTVCVIYDLQYKTYPQFFTPEDTAHRDRMFVEACRKSTVLAAISEYSRSSAIQHGNLDPTRIRAILLRLALRTQPGKDTDILDSFGLEPGRYLIYPANFWKHKNHEMLLTAFGMARHRGLPEDIRLICTGAPGERQDWLIKAARAMGLENMVLFPGYVSDEALATLITDSTGLVFPSLYEGFGMPVIEAMALGVPVACGNVASLPEIATGSARFFDPRVPEDIAAAMVELTTDPVLREHLNAAGRQRAAEFSDTERMAREYWELFELALELGHKETTLTGLYPDGWAGTSLNLRAAPAEMGQTLEIEFSAPPWLPEACVTAQAHHQGKPTGRAMTIPRGASKRWSLPLEASGGQYSVTLWPSFVPAGQSADNQDYRELTIMVERCGITLADGEYLELFAK